MKIYLGSATTPPQNGLEVTLVVDNEAQLAEVIKKLTDRTKRATHHKMGGPSRKPKRKPRRERWGYSSALANLR